MTPDLNVMKGAGGHGRSLTQPTRPRAALRPWNSVYWATVDTGCPRGGRPIVCGLCCGGVLVRVCWPARSVGWGSRSKLGTQEHSKENPRKRGKEQGFTVRAFPRGGAPRHMGGDCGPPGTNPDHPITPSDTTKGRESGAVAAPSARAAAGSSALDRPTPPLTRKGDSWPTKNESRAVEAATEGLLRLLTPYRLTD